ncbi:BTB/POZ domain-containing protein DOT3 isoform X3 [Benincasa hispida]|uniref:BTB/POZ domain-containing protein DOT3 isoform X3 n=1 Tax=Benincasa hispida TaxID=102211 RepID=UPI0019028098|nr:BTB/POZ domain-containing protein DOT3 isoform X3 [Benincasa hispida]
MKSLPGMPNPGSDSDGADQVHDQRIVISNKLVTKADCIDSKDQSWFITTQIPTDLTIQVQEITFNVHKYTLISKCGYIGRMELQSSITTQGGYDLKLENFPGGLETFETVLKYCYGLPVDLNSSNVAPLRCASEFLEMTEEFEDGNLISKTESFLTFVVLLSWKESLVVLKTCESLSPWAENLQIVRRCCDSIARKLSRENIVGDTVSEEGWWLNDITTLCIDYFTRIITAIRAKGLIKPEIIGQSIEQYARKWLPGIEMEPGLREHTQDKSDLQVSILSGRKDELGIVHSKEHKATIESLLSILPPQREAVSCKFLLQMLKMARLYSASAALISELEKRIGMVLEDANVIDILIPNCTNIDQGNLPNTQEERTMHDIEVVQRLLEYYSLFEQQQQQHRIGNSNVCKLIDNYLAELARDPNLSITKFQTLANSLSENARHCHDGLYRAIDTYLKTHPLLSEHDRRKLCKIMNCEKLSLDACVHAAQNDRLPLRTIVQINMQVLFSEQVKMRSAMQEKEKAPSSDSDQDGNHLSTDREIKNLKTELESVKAQMAELQSDYSELQQEYEKLSNKQKNITSWGLGWKKIKNSFHTRVDGDEPAHRRPSRTSSRMSLRRRLSIT